MENYGAPGFDGQGLSLGRIDKAVRDRRLTFGAMGVHLRLARDNLKAAVVESGIGNGEPDGDHLRAIAFFVGNRAVLVPVRGHNVRRCFRVAQSTGGWFEAHMLDLVGGNFWPDQILHHIEQPGRGEHVEHGRSNVEGGVSRDFRSG